MTDELGRGSYRVDVDKTKAEASIKGFETAAKKSGDAVEKAVGKQATGAFGKLDASIKKITQGGGITGAILGGVGIGAGLGVFSAVTMGIGMVTDFMGDAVDAASDLAESQSKVNVVFDKGAQVITDWSKDAAEAMGLSQQAALEAAGTFGNLFDALGLAEDATVGMSEGAVQLASDLASFNNVPVEEALLAIRSGLLGEAEPMRKFGSALSASRVEAYGLAKGMATANGKLTEAAKVQARYALMLEDTANAQGDFARTSDGLANSSKIADAKMKDLQARIGQGLIPIMLELNKVVLLGIEGIDALGDSYGAWGEVGKTALDSISRSRLEAMAAAGQWIELEGLLAQALGLTNEALQEELNVRLNLDKTMTEQQATAQVYAEFLRGGFVPAVAQVAATFEETGGAAKTMTTAVTEAVEPLPDIVSAAFVKTGKKTRIALGSALQDLKKDAQLGTKEIGWAMNHPNRDQTMADFLKEKIDDAEKKRRRALREGNTTALTIIDEHLAIWKAKAAALAATKWRYNMEFVLSLGGEYTKDTFVPIGKRAGGGPVRAHMPYVVGETRPELFVPDRNGTILPSVPTGGRQDVYHHISPDGARSLMSAGYSAADVGAIFAEANRTATTRYTSPRR